MDLKAVPSLVDIDTTGWLQGTWVRFTTQLLSFTSTLVVTARGNNVVVTTSDKSTDRLRVFWAVMLQLQVSAAEDKERDITKQLERETAKAFGWWTCCIISMPT
jgi:hypothetical protein